MDKWKIKENNNEIPYKDSDNKQCILCGRINYGGAKFEVVVGRIKSDYVCLQCIEKGRKDEAVLKCSV